MSDSFEHFSVRRFDDGLTIELADPMLFDTAVVMAWQNELLKLVDSERPRRAIVDFSKVEHCSTAVINGLLRARRRIAKDGGQMKLCGMRTPIRDAYALLNLDGTVFLIYDSVDDALDAF